MSNQDRYKSLNKRTSRPHTLASAFGGVMKAFGRTRSDADLAERWDEIMGKDISDIAKLAGIAKTRDGMFNISVRPANPALALQLSYEQEQIKSRINKYFGFNAVNKIIIRK